MENKEIFQFNTDGTFRIKTKIKSLGDLAKVANFLQEIKLKSEKHMESITLSKTLTEIFEENGISEIILDYLTYENYRGKKIVDVLV